MNSIKDNTVYIMCECVTRPEDVHMDVLNEATVPGSDAKFVTIDTVLQSFEVENWNERIYGKDVVMEAIDNDPNIQTDLKMGQWMGEYGHPLDTEPKRQVVFNPSTCSHRILNYRTEGNLLKAHVQTLSGGCGEMMRQRIMQGIPAAFSLRSLGTIDLETRRVKKPLKVLTYDSVYRPSHVEAYQLSILQESANVFKTKDSDFIYPINESMSEIEKLIENRSDNVKIIADMFNLDKVNLVLTESNDVKMVIDNSTIARIPLEASLQMQFNKVFTKKF